MHPPGDPTLAAVDRNHSRQELRVSLRLHVRAVTIASALLAIGACSSESPTGLRSASAPALRKGGSESEVPPPAPAPAPVVVDIAGTWSGTLQYPNSARTESWVLRVDQRDATLDGTIERTFSGVTESSKSKLGGSIDAAGNVFIAFQSGESKSNSTFRGTLSPDGLAIVGTFLSYGATSQPIAMTLYR
jgi:hypothetical protein